MSSQYVVIIQHRNEKITKEYKPELVFKPLIHKDQTPPVTLKPDAVMSSAITKNKTKK